MDLPCRIKVGGAEGHRNALDSISSRVDVEAQDDSEDIREEADGVAEAEETFVEEATSVVEVGAASELQSLLDYVNTRNVTICCF